MTRQRLSDALACLALYLGLCMCEICNFERNYCNWKSTTTESFPQFERNRARRYGPTLDATYRNKSGHFYLLLGRFGPGNATLESDWYGPGNGSTSLIFRLTFNGIAYGNAELGDGISILLKNQSATHVIKAINGTTQTNWTSYTVDLDIQREPFKIVLIGSVVYKQAFVAIDDIGILQSKDGINYSEPCSLEEIDCGDGSCVAKDAVGDFKLDCDNGMDENDTDLALWPKGARCDFEEGLCGWTNNQEDSFDWTLHRGPTPTSRTGPSVDHTKGTADGYYIYIDSTDRMSEMAVLESPIFPPMSPDVLNNSSIFKHSCKFRFFYHMKGRYHSYLKVKVRSACVPSLPRTIGKIDTFQDVDQWIYRTFTLTAELMQDIGSFRISIIGQSGMKEYGDLGLDDISLSPGCFRLDKNSLSSSLKDSIGVCQNTETTTEDAAATTADRKQSRQQHTSYDFTPCNSYGKDGPTQEQCNSAYSKSKVVVNVIQDGLYKGVQVWTVPENATYEINVAGAGGGEGVKTERSRGALIQAKFQLLEGEKLYILVGQEGTRACNAEFSSHAVREICRKGHAAENSTYERQRIGGGGGGGGASYVFKIDPDSHIPVPLLVAGGGGGQAYKVTSDNSSSPFRSNYQDIIERGVSVGENGYTNPTGAGGGGGFNGTTVWTHAGKSLLQGARGGDSCDEVRRSLNWNTPGGFGGGGGACSAGGGGGGYTGGDAARVDGLFNSGQGGTSYAHPNAVDPKLHSGEQNQGFVEIDIWIEECENCKSGCKVDWKTRKARCMGDKVDEPPSSTNSFNETFAEGLSAESALLRVEYIILIASACTLMTLAIVASFVCLVRRRQKEKHLNAVRLELLSVTQSFNIRPPTMNGNVTDRPISNPRRMAEYNPTYDFGDFKYTDQQLKELNRNNLKLVRALGQGAFGEVYKGFMAGVANSKDQHVAVKTLSSFSTQESELDFLMEAIIMSKFHHPNIVRFIGVCFESHPRYIVLELLEGGDLKTFLREIRPKPDLSPPITTVLDLLKLAIDIARGCQHLEERHFIHRDIAARNCLLTSKGVRRQAKIADFGMARDVYRSDYYKKGGKAMLPIKWMPPEAFLDGVFTSKTDVWSFGILLWEIFSMGYMPYPGRTNHDVMQFVTGGGRLEPPDKCPHSIVQLMNICWAAIPETRPTFSEVLEYLQRSTKNPDIINGELPNFFMIPSFGKEKSDMSISENIPASVTIETTLNEAGSDFEDDREGASDPETECREPLLSLSTSSEIKTCNDGNTSKSDRESSKVPSLVVNLPDDLKSTKSDKTSLLGTGFTQPVAVVDTMVQTSLSQDLSFGKKSNSRVSNQREKSVSKETSPLIPSRHSQNTDKSKGVQCDSENNANNWNISVNKPKRSSVDEIQYPSPHTAVKRMKSANI